LGPYSGTATAGTPAAPDLPPSAPGTPSLAATVPTRVDLSWAAATDDLGVSLYEIDRCVGAGCSTFTPLTTATVTSASDLTVVASTTYTYRVRARDTANQPGPYSGSATVVTPAAPDTTPPGATTGLSAAAVSSARIDLSWTAAIDNVGVARYRVERCTGAACTTFAEIGTSTTVTYSDTSVVASTTYRYQVRAEDLAGLRGAYSNTASATTPAAPTAVGLVAAYAFDEGTGTVSVDATGLGHTVALGGATWIASGHTGSALSFNGTSARSTIADANDLDLTSAMTLMAWVYPTVVPSGWRTVLHKETDRFYLFAGSGGAGPAGGGTFGSGNVNAYGPSALPAGAWSHLATTFDGATVRLYVNGALVTSAPATGGIGVSGSPLAIGGSAAYGEFFGGRIDDVRVYNRALSVSEIAQDMNTAVGSAPPANPPRLIINTPAAGATVPGSLLSIAYTTTGDLAGFAVDHVHFQLDAEPMVMDMTFDGSYQMPGVHAGAHTLRGWLVRADHSAILGSDATPVSFSTIVDPSDPVPPSVAITAPSSGATVSGTVAVTANASDAVGVYGVQFRLDGVNLGAEDLVAPYSLNWNTTTFTNGAHTLTAIARDVAGNETTSVSLPVTVSNLNPNDPALVGQWAGPFTLPMITVHTTLMPNGKVLFYDDHTVDPGVQVWDPVTDALNARPYNARNLFCSAHTLLPDGRVIAVGGHAANYLGIPDLTVFNPATETWSQLAPMTYGRWYPTATNLGDGRVLVVSGAENCPTCLTPGVSHPGIALIPEIYNPPTNTWTLLNSASLSLPLYPHMFVLPDGRVFASSTQEDPIVSRVLNIASGTWSTVDPVQRDGGSSVQYRSGKILKTGSARNPDYPPAPSSATAWVIDMNLPSPTWRSVPSMAFARTQHNLTSLPDGNVLVVGGGTTSDVNAVSSAIKAAELWSPDTETFRTLASMQEPRLYHSTSLLLPDGRVVVSGGGRFGPDFPSYEFYSPPYLFKGPRPAITSAPSTLEYGAHFAVGTPSPSGIAKVTLLRLGAPTHAIDMNQRYLELTFQVAGANLDVTAPANGNLAPPGHYMLFLVDSIGVPSQAAIVRLPAPWEDASAPTAPTSLTATGALGSVSLSWGAASDNQGVARYNVHRSATAGFTPSPANFIGFSTTTTYQDNGLTPGTYRYRVTAQDAAGNVGPPSNEATGVALADTTPPTVSMTAPAAGATVSGTVTVSANASDNGTLAGVQFLLDGAPLLAEDTTAPYSISWSTPTAANGAHTLSARARDAAGNQTTSATVGVTVSNLAPSSLVAAYAFSEGSGPTSADATGLGHTVTVGSASWIASGHTGNALSFNGTTARSTVADANDLDLSSAMTLMAWVYPNVTPQSWRTILHKETDVYYLFAGSSGPGTAGGGTFGSGNVNAYGPSALPAGTWTHVATTYDGTTVRLYVGGTLVASAPATGSILSSSSPLSIGGTAAYGEYFNGRIDDVRVYNRALSAAEIQQDMLTPVP
jgi:fibronectin type 3 domain-containing protein